MRTLVSVPAFPEVWRFTFPLLFVSPVMLPETSGRLAPSLQVLVRVTTGGVHLGRIAEGGGQRDVCCRSSGGSEGACEEITRLEHGMNSGCKSKLSPILLLVKKKVQSRKNS